MMAKKGAIVHGYEVNPILVWRSRNFIKNAGLEKKAFIHWKSFWGEDLSKFDVITVYGITYIMEKLEKKLQSELKPGTRVVSNYFTFPTWKPAKQDGEILLYSSTSTFKSK